MILYTKTVCPKCMFVKSELNEAGLEGRYETVNIDLNAEAKEKIVNAGFLTVPILEIDGQLIHDFSQINEEISKLVG
ncbi:glutaredoxin family protein [Bacillus ndiopicus]|uniref:glutaredoxin family protein n=1 Tax=Bacillus ndiopicus TaxID=1347368 RepID=UPI0005AB492E|nr:glutaredoxin [Bacillus ndiopicus]